MGKSFHLSEPVLSSDAGDGHTCSQGWGETGWQGLVPHLQQVLTVAGLFPLGSGPLPRTEPSQVLPKQDLEAMGFQIKFSRSYHLFYSPGNQGQRAVGSVGFLYFPPRSRQAAANLSLELVRLAPSLPPHVLHGGRSCLLAQCGSLPPPSPEGHGGLSALSSLDHTFLSFLDRLWHLFALR